MSEQSLKALWPGSVWLKAAITTATDERWDAACLELARSVKIWRVKMGDASLRFLPVGLA